MQKLDGEIRGITDLPVRFIGIQEQNVGFSSAMFSSTTLTWLREIDGQEPSKTWAVPTRPSGEVYYRDAIILDHNNEFVAVQNLTSNPISDLSTNYSEFKKLVTNAATKVDSDGDRLPDYWEQEHPNPILPPLINYATGGSSSALSISRISGQSFTLSFRYRIPYSSSGLVYAILASTDGGRTWSAVDQDDLSPLGSRIPYDGTATGISSYGYTPPSTTPGPDTLFRLYVATQP